jgi:hypothetical protein
MALGATIRKLQDENGIALTIWSASEYELGTQFNVAEPIEKHFARGDVVEMVIENDVMSIVYYGTIGARLVLSDRRILGIEHDHLTQPTIVWSKEEWQK